MTRIQRMVRWLTIAASGAMLFQAAGCDPFLQVAQTGLLAAIAGMLAFLARNV